MYLWIIFLLLLKGITCCPNGCSDHGFCDNGDCRCFSGYFKVDCSKSLKDDHQTEIIVLQAIMGTMFLLLFTLAFTAFYDSQRRNAAGLILITNVRSLVFAIISVIALTHGIYAAADPWSFYFMPRLANRLLFMISFPLAICCFTGILFHWIEVIRTSISTIKKENMMQSINVHYKGKEVTVEDMVERVKFLRKLKIPFVVFLVFLTALVCIIQIVATVRPKLTAPLFAIMFSLIGLCWVFLLLGFLIYGRRLIRLMPFELTKKVKRLTKKLTILSAITIVVLIVLVPVLLIEAGSNENTAMARYVVAEVAVCLICTCICFVFLRWKNQFPFIILGETTTRNSSTAKKTKSNPISASDSMELYPKVGANDL